MKDSLQVIAYMPLLQLISGDVVAHKIMDLKGELENDQVSHVYSKKILLEVNLDNLVKK